MERKIRTIALAAATALVLIALPLTAQDWTGNGRMQGRVLDQEGNPIAGAEIVLHPPGSKEAGPAALHTGKDGQWAILGLAPGQWSVTISKDGYVSSEGTVHVPGAGPAPMVVIKLRPVPKEVREKIAAAAAVDSIQKGNTLMQKKDYAGARKLFEEALEKLPDAQKPIVLRGIAQTYYREGNSKDAIGTLKRALTLEPKDPATLQLMATLLVADNREDEAKQYLDQIPAGGAIDTDTALNI
ncbi:MAG TPA: tetratricopeptide repeat protein, partial [Candidatus Krumholzibacteria bacterium]|nr:tetratricopeptide repeat protein [Candidatus Krumholzibacteria bacterium]